MNVRAVIREFHGIWSSVQNLSLSLNAIHRNATEYDNFVVGMDTFVESTNHGPTRAPLMHSISGYRAYAIASRRQCGVIHRMNKCDDGIPIIRPISSDIWPGDCLNWICCSRRCWCDCEYSNPAHTHYAIKQIHWKLNWLNESRNCVCIECGDAQSHTFHTHTHA